MLLFIHIVSVTQWLEDHMLTCPSRKYLHIECPGCGFQRSFVALLKGDWLVSLQLYPATLPLLALITFAILHLRFGFRNGAGIIKWLQIFAASIIVISYLFKIINHKILV